MKIWVARVDTEDTEEYFYAFKEKPSDKQVKKVFFSEEDKQANYDPEDWHNTIGCKIFDLEIQ